MLVCSRADCQSRRYMQLWTPLIKKPALDASDLANFRPVSNLTFMSKVVERAVAEQLNSYGI